MISIKNYLKKLPVLLSVLSLLLCSVLSLPVCVSATSAGSFVLEVIETLNNPEYMTVTGDFSGDGSYSNSLFVFGMFDAEGSPLAYPSGTYVVSGSPYVISSSSVPAAQVLVVNIDTEQSTPYDFGEVFTIPSDASYSLLVQSFTSPTIEAVSPSEPLYYSAFQMFGDFIYGEGAILTSEQKMVLTILATATALAVVILPFVIVFWASKLFFPR